MLKRSVHLSEKGMRLDRFVRIHFTEVPFGQMSSLLKRGSLTVDGKRAKATDRLAAGQVVTIAAGPGRGPGATGAAAAAVEPLAPADLAFLQSITLYQDDDLIVFDKPAGLAVHAGTGTTRDLDALLARWLDGEGERPLLVHRLDKDTSGVLVAARRKAIAGQLGKAFAGREVEKEYRAIIAGRPNPARGAFDVALKKVATPKGGRMVAAQGDDPDGQASLTDYQVVSTSADGARSLVALFPRTGRQHQLRVHLAMAGHPILGDRLYGDAATLAAAPRLMLHAHRLRFRSPRGGDLDLVAPVPAEFADLIAGAPVTRR